MGDSVNLAKRQVVQREIKREHSFDDLIVDNNISPGG